jgi:hypothetical protein
MSVIPKAFKPGTSVTLDGIFTDADGFLIDPETISFRLMSPDGEETSFVYPGAITRAEAGKYSVTVKPDGGGVWSWRWETETDGKAFAPEGSFVVEVSRFVDGRRDRYRQ